MPAVMLLMLVGVAASVVVAAYEPADSGDSAPAYDNSGAAADDVYAAAELAETEGHRGYKHRHGHHHHTGRKHHEDPEYDNPFGNEYTEEPSYHRHEYEMPKYDYGDDGYHHQYSPPPGGLHACSWCLWLYRSASCDVCVLSTIALDLLTGTAPHASSVVLGETAPAHRYKLVISSCMHLVLLPLNC